jgi:hypothetical protein
MTLAIVVNSCVSFSPTTMPIFLDSMRLARIPLSNVYCILGESDVDSIDTSNEYTVIKTRFCNVDNTAAVYLTQTDHGRSILNAYTHIFYTHDTVRFLEGFWTTIQTYLPSCSSYRKLQESATKTTGLLHSQWFLREKSKVMKYLANTDIDKRYAYKSSIGIPNEADIRANCSHLPQWLNEDVIFDFKDDFGATGDWFVKNADVPTHFEDIYGTGTVRKAYVYNPPGIIKYQKNFVIVDNNWQMNL